MHQPLLNHDLARLKLERLHREARTRQLLQHHRHQTGSGWPAKLAGSGSAAISLIRRVLHALRARGAPQR